MTPRCPHRALSATEQDVAHRALVPDVGIERWNTTDLRPPHTEGVRVLHGSRAASEGLDPFDEFIVLV
jgi:hypothetical protein